MLKHPIYVLKQTELLGHQFTVYGTAENPLFLVKEIAEVLEYSERNSCKLTNLVEKDEKVRNIITTLGGNQEVWLLTEDGLYEVLMQSRKPIAKQFKKGVKQILHEVRTTGGYIATKADDTPEEIMARALTIAQATLEKREERLKQLEAENKQKQEEITELRAENVELQHQSEYARFILQSKKTVLVTQIAQDYGMTAIRFNALLRDLHIQRKVNGQWILYGEYLGKGYVHSATHNYTHSNGSPDVSLNTEWTQKGRLFLYEELKRNGILPLIERSDKN
ncbi:phage antirepressor KilAC domain-containing protein [Parabacteroides distasonis]|uniref:Phage antirepressor protein n=1 Tax=Parabacteroides distasonis TaxID=823 RepID=A0A4S2EIY6_PARDI|nr:phage antirepressor KilAC domain-containing protein [Parabacteroides distasonis]TGY54144.1 phage antirepressor protein [Parabacteroides distasonis]